MISTLIGPAAAADGGERDGDDGQQGGTQSEGGACCKLLGVSLVRIGIRVDSSRHLRSSSAIGPKTGTAMSRASVRLQ